jgi:2-haloacid dehalogenase
MDPRADLRDVTALMFDFYGTEVDIQAGLTEAITPYLQQVSAHVRMLGRVVGEGGFR